MMDGYSGHGWGMGWWWIIGMILLVLIIWMVVKALNTQQRTDKKQEKTALDILKERYAKGEISKQEYEERRRDLM